MHTDYSKRVQKLSERGLEREVEISPEQLSELIAAMDCQTAQAFTRLLSTTGMRFSELYALQPEQIDGFHFTLHASGTKAKRPRTVEVPKSSLKYLKQVPFDQKVTTNHLRMQFETARAEVCRPDVRFHDLRHHFATETATKLAGRINLLQLQKLLGHSSPTMTQRYAHILEGKGKKRSMLVEVF